MPGECNVKIRRFIPDDAEFCFRLRSSAFIHRFYNELGPEATAAGINAYLPSDYIQLANELEFFLVEGNGMQIGFFTIKRINPTTAEIPLIYLGLNHLGKGIGSKCMQFIEDWLPSNWENVKELIVDTIIPKYNAVFYEKMGFTPIGETICEFAELRVKALRLYKSLRT